MTHDEQEAALRAALQRELPPLGFTQRVEAQIAAEGRASSQRRKSWAQLAVAAGLMLAIVLPLGLRLHHEADVARGEAAKAQVLLAFHVTGTQLRTIQARTQSRHVGTMPEGVSQ